MNTPRGARCTGRSAQMIKEYSDVRRGAGHSEGTIELNARYLHRLGVEHPLDKVTEQQLSTWMAAHVWSRSTRRVVRSALRTFFAWAHRTGRIAHDPAIDLPGIRQSDPLAKPTPDAVYRRAVKQASEEELLMLLLAAHCGMRRAEIASMHTDLITGSWIYVTGKGDKPRRIPIRNAQLAQILGDLEPGWLFPGRFGGPVTPDYVGRRLSRLLGPGWSAHSLRHRYASTIHTGCRDILALQKLLGHRSSETTRLYVATDDEALWAAAGWAA